MTPEFTEALDTIYRYADLGPVNVTLVAQAVARLTALHDADQATIAKLREESGSWKEHYNVAEKRSDKQALTLIDMHCEVAGLRNLLRRIEPYIDSIVCYASTMGEHEPNRIAVDLRAALEPPR